MLKELLYYLVNKGAEFKNIEFSLNGVKAVNRNKEFFIKLPKSCFVRREGFEIADDEHYAYKEFCDYKEILDEYINFRFSKFDLNFWIKVNNDISDMDNSIKGKLRSYGLDFFLEKNYPFLLKDRFFLNDCMEIDGMLYFIPLYGMFKKNFVKGVEKIENGEFLIFKGMPRSNGDIVLFEVTDVFSNLDKMKMVKSNLALSMKLSDINQKYSVFRNFDKYKIKKEKLYPEFENNGFSFVAVGGENFFYIFDEFGMDKKIYKDIIDTNLIYMDKILNKLNKYNNLGKKVLKEAFLIQKEMIKKVKSSFEDIS